MIGIGNNDEVGSVLNFKNREKHKKTNEIQNKSLLKITFKLLI